jgi:hypothetical protein
MAVTANVYAQFFLTLENKEVDWDTDTLKCMLLTSTYTPNQTTHKYKSDLTNEVSGTGYTATGAALTSVTVTNSGLVMTFDAADTSWTTSTITARYAVIYDSTPATDATRPLICLINFGADVSTTAATFLITWNASGIVSFTAA